MTPSQFQALEDIERYGDPFVRVHGQSQHGGWFRVMMVINRNGWAESGKRRWTLTTKGRSAMRAHRSKTRSK